MYHLLQQQHSRFGFTTTSEEKSERARSFFFRAQSEQTQQHFYGVPQRNAAGFTLIEVLLAVALLSLIAGIGAPIYYSVYARSETDAATLATVQSMRRAQTLARASEGGTSWGVYIDEGSVTLFQGDAYAERDTTFDESTVIAQSVMPSGDVEYIFVPTTGRPHATGTLLLTSQTGNVQSVSVNILGTIDY